MDHDFITSDTYEASVLMSLGCKIKDINSDDGKTVHFVFEKTPEFVEIINKYLSKSSQVEPFTLKSNMDYCYSRVRGIKNYE